MTRALIPAIVSTALCVSAQEIRVTPSDVTERVRDAEQRRKAFGSEDSARKDQIQESLRQQQARRQGRCSVPLLTFKPPAGIGAPKFVLPVPKSYTEEYPRAFYKQPPAPPCEDRQELSIDARPRMENKRPKLP